MAGEETVVVPKPRRVCAVIDCPKFTNTTRCEEHARPNAHRRGYDGKHRAERARILANIQAGMPVTCWRCGLPIDANTEWDLGHDDNDRTITRGPEHARQCNRAAAGKKSADLAQWG